MYDCDNEPQTIVASVLIVENDRDMKMVVVMPSGETWKRTFGFNPDYPIERAVAIQVETVFPTVILNKWRTVYTSQNHDFSGIEVIEMVCEHIHNHECVG